MYSFFIFERQFDLMTCSCILINDLLRVLIVSVCNQEYFLSSPQKIQIQFSLYSALQIITFETVLIGHFVIFLKPSSTFSICVVMHLNQSKALATWLRTWLICTT